MQAVLIVVHLFLALSIIGLVLIQHGKGADAGAAFGSGASATIFGARGSTSFLSHSTAIMASLFFTSSLALAYFSSQVTESQGIMQQLPTDKEQTVPASDKSENLSVPAATVDTKLNQETKTVAMGSEPVPVKEKLDTPKIVPKVESVKPVAPPQPVVLTPVPAPIPSPMVPKVETVKPVAPPQPVVITPVPAPIPSPMVPKVESVKPVAPPPPVVVTPVPAPIPSPMVPKVEAVKPVAPPPPVVVTPVPAPIPSPIVPKVEAVKPVAPPQPVVTPVAVPVPAPTVPKVEDAKPVAPATDTTVK